MDRNETDPQYIIEESDVQVQSPDTSSERNLTDSDDDDDYEKDDILIAANSPGFKEQMERILDACRETRTRNITLAIPKVYHSFLNKLINWVSQDSGYSFSSCATNDDTFVVLHTTSGHSLK